MEASIKAVVIWLVLLRSTRNWRARERMRRDKKKKQLKN